MAKTGNFAYFSAFFDDLWSFRWSRQIKSSSSQPIFKQNIYMVLSQTRENRNLILEYAERILCRQAGLDNGQQVGKDLYAEDLSFQQSVDTLVKRLVNHIEFDLKDYFDVEEEWSIFNLPLIDFLKHSPYRCISMHLTRLLLTIEIESMEHLRYRPAQDYLALLCGKEGSLILEAFERISGHVKEGYRRQLTYDEIIIHDELCGTVPDHFDPQALMAAQKVFEVFARNARISRNYYLPGTSWNQQPEPFRNEFSCAMSACSEIIVEIGKKYFPDGRLEEGALSYNYLIAHAEDAIMGNWSEEGTV